MNQAYLNEARTRARDAKHLAEVFMSEFKMHGAPPDAVERIAKIISGPAKDVLEMAEEIERLNEELRQQGLAELAQRPWEWDEERKRLVKAARGVLVSPCQAYDRSEE